MWSMTTALLAPPLPIPIQSHQPYLFHHTRARPTDWIISHSPPHRPRLSTRCQAAGDTSSSIVYKGVYGPWTVDSSDVQEVVLYRSGLVTAAASFVVASSTAFLPNNYSLAIQPYLNLLYSLGAAGLGLSLFLIHIYVTPIKRTLQALWGLGVLGSFATYTALAQPAGDDNLVHYVIYHPAAVWLVGPLFAAFTGLVFKEGKGTTYIYS